jgi:hypothetical protein
MVKSKEKRQKGIKRNALQKRRLVKYQKKPIPSTKRKNNPIRNKREKKTRREEIR